MFQTANSRSKVIKKPTRSRDDKFAEPKSRQNPPHFEPKVSETTLGKVKVVVKSKLATEQPKVKKTGALSPRAPEKIKKNRAEEMKIFGENACLALFAQRPDSIVRVWATVEMAHKIGDMFSYLAANKKVYHVVDRAELELVSGSEHHGGICMLVKKPRTFTLSGYLDIPRASDCLILLDGVANNPQNIGGIIRSCAFYGVKGVLTSAPELLFAPNAARVAEGGMEYVHILQTEGAASALKQLRAAGYQIVHCTNHKGELANGSSVKTVNEVKFSDKLLLVLADENLDFAELNDILLNLSLANPLKTGLNVAVATGVLLAKWVAR